MARAVPSSLLCHCIVCFLASNCSEGLVRCFQNPCNRQHCPNFPNATCNVSNCGRCSAHFFLNGRNVTDACRNATPTCPDGSPIVRCASDPCLSATCPTQPGARCQADYCGRCGFIFRNASGHDVTRLCRPSKCETLRQFTSHKLFINRV